MKKIGNLTVTKENAQSFPAVTEFYGHLTIAQGAELIAPKLTMIRGWLTVYGKLTAPQLGLVDGWLTLKDEASLHALYLAEVRNDLTVGKEVEFGGEALRTAGAINMLRGADAGYHVLTEVRDSVTVGTDGSLGCPLLTRIGKSLTLREKAWFGAPELSFIGGYLDADETAVLHVPKFL
jgi:hypothetical protein